LAHNEEDVFDALLGTESAKFEANETVAPEELAQVVVSLGFDFTRLTAQNIKDLLADGKGLNRFLDKVATFSQAIPPGLGEEERHRRIRAKAEEIIGDWNDYKGVLPKFAREALIDKSIEEVPKELLKALPELTWTTVLAVSLGGVKGIAISLITTLIAKRFAQRNGPYKFLNRVDKMERKNIGDLYVPQWREMIGVETKADISNLPLRGAGPS
jgi:hypothetical protein